MQKNFWKLGAVVAIGVLAAQMAWAQPDPTVTPKGVNPPENTRPNRMNRGNPAEMQQRMETAMRQMLTQAGVNDAPTQDAVLAYVKADTDARRPLREQSMKLFQAVRNGGVTDDQLLALVTDYRAAQQSEKARREKAEADLDAQVHYSKNPRLEALLLLSGMIGDSGNPMMMTAGMGGRGGQNGPAGQNGLAGQNGQGARGNRAEMTPQQRELIQQKRKEFDKNGDGQLDDQERTAFRQWMRDNRQQLQHPAQTPAPNNAQPNNGQPNNDNPPPAAPNA